MFTNVRLKNINTLWIWQSFRYYVDLKWSEHLDKGSAFVYAWYAINISLFLLELTAPYVAIVLLCEWN